MFRFNLEAMRGSAPDHLGWLVQSNMSKRPRTIWCFDLCFKSSLTGNHCRDLKTGLMWSTLLVLVRRTLATALWILSDQLFKVACNLTKLTFSWKKTNLWAHIFFWQMFNIQMSDILAHHSMLFVISNIQSVDLVTGRSALCHMLIMPLGNGKWSKRFYTNSLLQFKLTKAGYRATSIDWMVGQTLVVRQTIHLNLDAWNVWPGLTTIRWFKRLPRKGIQ